MNNKTKLFLKETGLMPILIPPYRLLARLIRPWKIRRYLVSHGIRKLQIGSGPHILEGWLNTDINPDLGRRGGSSVFLDAAKPFPFKDETFDYVFCEHLIEHMEYRKGIGMLHECFRVLKRGGKIRISTPDMSFLMELYSPKKTELQTRYISRAVKTSLPEIGINEDVFVINNFFRAWGHKFIYDFKVLKRAMESVGFVGVSPQKVGESSDRNLSALEFHGNVIGDEFNRLETLIVEGRKPD
jgi:predicted SAM-dependent methyltransferase